MAAQAPGSLESELRAPFSLEAVSCSHHATTAPAPDQSFLATAFSGDRPNRENRRKMCYESSVMPFDKAKKPAMLEYHFEHAGFVESVFSASSNSVVLILNIMPPAKTRILRASTREAVFFDHFRNAKKMIIFYFFSTSPV